MTNEQRWADVGLGESGESYIVAQDFKLRNQSRFLIEDRENYFKMIEAIGTAPAVVTRIRNLNSTIGLQEVRTEGTEAALAGQTGTEVFPDYRGVPVLSSYQPLDIEDVDWVLMSEIDEAEAFAEVHRFRRNALLAFVVMMSGIVIVSLFFSRSFTRRINILTGYARRLAAHDFTQERIEVPQKLTQIASHRDEVGQLAKAFSKLGDDLQRSINNLRTTTASKERMQTELDVGRDIQMSMLPLLFPAYPEKEEFAVLLSARARTRGRRRLLRLLLPGRKAVLPVRRRRFRQGRPGGALHGRSQDAHQIRGHRRLVGSRDPLSRQ